MIEPKEKQSYSPTQPTTPTPPSSPEGKANDTSVNGLTSTNAQKPTNDVTTTIKHDLSANNSNTTIQVS